MKAVMLFVPWVAGLIYQNGMPNILPAQGLLLRVSNGFVTRPKRLGPLDPATGRKRLCRKETLFCAAWQNKFSRDIKDLSAFHENRRF
jgi:hypothetical protein